MSKTRLVYVLPTYDANSQEHLYHIYGFLQAVARQAEVWLIIERAKGTPSFPGIRVHRRRLQIPVLRAIEVGVVMLLARLHGCRVFYSHYSVSGAILSALVTRLLGGESFYWNCVHTLDFVPARPKTWSDWKLKLRNQYLLGLALHLVHHLVTGTPTMARYYSNGYNLNLSSVRVMPNWVDLKRFENLPEKAALRAELGWPTHQQIILFLHRVVERKGAHYIVPIAREILARSVGQPSPLVVAAGSGPYEARLLAEIRAAGLGDVVRQVGGIPNRDAIRYFAAADVYMVPSTEEGFPRTLLEAMAAGCPFVTTDVGGVRDILTPEQAQFIVPVGDVQRMAVSVIRLLTDHILHESLVREGHANVQYYAQDRVVQTFVAMVSR